MNISERLKTIPLFYHLREKDIFLKQIINIIRIEKFAENTFIIQEDDIGDKMYILNRGKVRVMKKTPSRDQFTVANFNEEMNVHFGELALIDEDLRSASVLAVSDVECFSIKKGDFDSLCNQSPEIGYTVMKEIAKSLSERIRRINTDKINLIEALITDDF